ncbi:hypothetical protein KC356_g306 [Hortaea werneckii]|nr:hypothetical protein KC356_g306 [Hortaea werneckii]
MWLRVPVGDVYGGLLIDDTGPAAFRALRRSSVDVQSLLGLTVVVLAVPQPSSLLHHRLTFVVGHLSDSLRVSRVPTRALRMDAMISTPSARRYLQDFTL